MASGFKGHVACCWNDMMVAGAAQAEGKNLRVLKWHVGQQIIFGQSRIQIMELLWQSAHIGIAGISSNVELT